MNLPLELPTELPVKSAFLYDINQTPVYIATYILYCYIIYVTIFISVSNNMDKKSSKINSFVSLFLILFLKVGVDSFFFNACLNVWAHFDLLKIELNKRLFIEKHCYLLVLSKKLNKLMKFIIFIQFLMSSLNLCVLGFQFVMLDNIFKRIVTVFFGLAIIIQLFIYAFGGQLIMDKSSTIADDLFDMDKDTLLIIARTQTPIRIKSGFFEANLSTFRNCLSRAGSLITLLQSLVDKND